MRYAEMRSQFVLNDLEVGLFKLCYVFRQILLLLSGKYSIQLDVFSCSCWSNKISDDHWLWQIDQVSASLIAGLVLAFLSNAVRPSHLWRDQALPMKSFRLIRSNGWIFKSRLVIFERKIIGMSSLWNPRRCFDLFTDINCIYPTWSNKGCVWAHAKPERWLPERVNSVCSDWQWSPGWPLYCLHMTPSELR